MAARELVAARFATMNIPANNFLLTANDGSADGKCSHSGTYGNIINDIILDNWLKHGHNCTLDSYDSLGHLEDGIGAKSSMKYMNNDALFIPVAYLEYDDESIEYSMQIFDSFLNIFCVYNYTDHMDETDLMDAYLQFPWSYYTSILSSLVVFILAWKVCACLACKMSQTLKEELRKSRLPSYWIMICAILDQDQYPNISRVAFSILSFCFSFLFFVAIDCFMLNTMSADLVVIEEPAVVRTYEDALEREGLKLVFMEGMEDAEFFRSSDPGTIENQIWDRRVMIKDATMEVIASVWQPLLGQEMVGICRDWIGNGAMNLALSQMHQIGVPNLRGMVTKDETGKMITHAFMQLRDASPVLKNFLERQMQLVSQSGILEWFFMKRMPRIFGDSEIALDQYVSKNLFLAEAPEPRIKINNVYKLVHLYFVLISMATLVLLFEKLKFVSERIVTGQRPKRRPKSQMGHP